MQNILIHLFRVHLLDFYLSDFLFYYNLTGQFNSRIISTHCPFPGGYRNSFPRPYGRQCRLLFNLKQYHIAVTIQTLYPLLSENARLFALVP